MSSSTIKKEVKVLAVDLDGTLINSDMLYETFWSAFANDILIPFKALFALALGKSYLKKMLYESSSVDIKTLPYNSNLIDYINLHLAKGWKVVLITATYQPLAKKIANNLNLFDEVYGSTLGKNLVGLNKANLLSEMFGFKSYNYIGNSYNDIHIWQNSEKAITYNASKSLRRKCEINNDNSLHLRNKDIPNIFFAFFKEMRSYQWIKNSLVFLPLLASKQFETNLFFNSIIAFFSFSIIASSLYFLNDLLDLKSDRYHPKKSKRPFAAGHLQLSLGTFSFIGLFIVGLSLGFFLGIKFLLSIFSYSIITTAYSLYFKKKALLDIFVLSGLYTIRIISGGFATNLEISFWLLAFSIFIFLSLASIKRQAELIDLVDRGKIEMQNRGYEIRDLDFLRSISICSGLIASLVLCLYINSSKVLELYTKPELLWFASGLFLYWTIRLCFKTDQGKMEYDPIIFAFKDQVSRVIFITIFALFLLAS